MSVPSTARCAQAGLTLLEVLLALAVLALVSLGLNQLADRFAEDTRAAIAANQLRTLGEAARSYLRDNYGAVQAVAAASTPALIDIATLTAAGKLPPGSNNSNSYGQASCVLVLQPTAGALQALVVTEGGSAIGDVALASIAGAVGGSGGGVYASDGSQIRGTSGGWQLATAGFDNLVNPQGRRCDGSSGNVRLAAGHPVMALWFENGDSAAPFVARDAVPGRPELNAMSTPLVMNAARTTGSACTTPGAIAQDGSGRVLSCQSGTWKPVGDGSCVFTSADLNTLQLDGRCYNGAGLPNSPAGGEWVVVEVYRQPNPAIYSLVQRATGMTGAALGKVWLRTQNSAGAAGGWSAWSQQADPGVSIGGSGAGTIAATGAISTNASLWANSSLGTAGQVSGSSVYASGAVQAGGTVYGGLFSSSGDMSAAGNVYTYANAVNYNGTTYNFGDSWGFLAYTTAGSANSEPGNPRGSVYVNDLYLRSRGEWASQMDHTLVLRGGAASSGGTSIAYCAAGETVVAGSCYGQDVCSGNDTSMHGGYPSGNAWVCPGWFCNNTWSFVTCSN